MRAPGGQSPFEMEHWQRRPRPTNKTRLWKTQRAFDMNLDPLRYCADGRVTDRQRPGVLDV